MTFILDKKISRFDQISTDFRMFVYELKSRKTYMRGTLLINISPRLSRHISLVSRFCLYYYLLVTALCRAQRPPAADRELLAVHQCPLKK